MEKVRRFVSLNLVGAIALPVLLASAVLAPNSAQAQTYNVIYTFRFFLDGAQPYSGVTIKADTLYGSTHSGNEGTSWGDVYQLRFHGSGWIYTGLHLFDGTLEAKPVFGPDNLLYGTSPNNISQLVNGYVYSLSPPISAFCPTIRCPWNMKVPYAFQNGSDGRTPRAGSLLFDHAGSMYGTTSAGSLNDNGAVYKLINSGGNWSEQTLYQFTGTPDGANPYSGLIFDALGNLYGTTMQGGQNNAGAVYKLTLNGGGYTESVIYSFNASTDGGAPHAGLIFDSAGNLYGATTSGGPGGAGTIFQLSPNGSGYDFHIIKSFSGGASCGPYASLSMDGSGNLYGTTYCGGTFNSGNVFKLTRSGSDFIYSSIYDFTGDTDGKNPYSDVSFDSHGNLYGTTSHGGMENSGVVWQIVP